MGTSASSTAGASSMPPPPSGRSHAVPASALSGGSRNSTSIAGRNSGSTRNTTSIVAAGLSTVNGNNGNNGLSQVTGTSINSTGGVASSAPRRRSSAGPLETSTSVSVRGGVMPVQMGRSRTAGSEASGNAGANMSGTSRSPTSGGGGGSSGTLHAPHLSLGSPYQLSHRSTTLQLGHGRPIDDLTFTPITDKGDQVAPSSGDNKNVAPNAPCLNPASEVNSRIDTQVEIKVYPCNNSHGKKKFTQFMVKPEGVIIQGTNRPPSQDIGTEYSRHVGRKLPRYELSDTRASQLLVTSHNKSYFVIPAPEAFSRHSGTCRLLGDRKHTPSNHSLKVGDFLRVGSVGVVVIETNNGVKQDVMSEERIQKIMQDTTVGGYVDIDGETDIDDNSDVETAGAFIQRNARSPRGGNTTEYEVPTCYMCFDDAETDTNPLISPCKCKGDTQFVHVECLRKWHTAEADNQICFLSTVDATCSVCKSSFKSDFKLKSGQLVKLFQSSLEPPYVSLLIATKHEMAQRLFNTRFQLSFHTLLKADGRNGTRPLLLGRSSGSDMVLDYRTVSARHASIKFKNGEFIFSDAGSSNGSYLYVRQPVELSSNGPSVQFRLGRSMISMKVVNKWNKRLLRAVVRRSTGSLSAVPSFASSSDHGNDGSAAGAAAAAMGSGERGRPNTRESILKSLPPLGMLSQQSAQHLDLIFALAIPKRDAAVAAIKRGASIHSGEESMPQMDHEEEKVEVDALEDLIDAVDNHDSQTGEPGSAPVASDFQVTPAGTQLEDDIDDENVNSAGEAVDEQGTSNLACEGDIQGNEGLGVDFDENDEVVSSGSDAGNSLSPAELIHRDVGEPAVAGREAAPDDLVVNAQVS